MAGRGFLKNVMDHGRFPRCKIYKMTMDKRGTSIAVDPSGFKMFFYVKNIH